MSHISYQSMKYITHLVLNLNLSRKMNTATTMTVLTAPNVSTVEVSMVIVKGEQQETIKFWRYPV